MQAHRTKLRNGALCALGSAVVIACIGALGASASGAKPGTFGANSNDITNPYLPISKFHVCRLGGTDGGQPLRIKRTLLDRTRTFKHKGQTFKAAVVSDRVHSRGRLIEKTVDYFAQDKAGIVYYLGEDVTDYHHGHVSHPGQWRLGRDTKTPGVLMPAHPKVGDVFTSESVPHVTHEVDHVVSSGKAREIGERTYHHVIKIRENASPPPEVEFKQYAPGTGVITEANNGIHLHRCS